MGYLSFVWEDPQDLGSMGLAGAAAAVSIDEYVGLPWGVGQCPWVIVCIMTVCLGLGDLLSLEGLLKKSVASIMSLSMSGSKSSKVLIFLGKGMLALGIVSKFLATLASHDVASFSGSLASSSKLTFLKEGGVTNSVGGMFSLSELKQSGSSKEPWYSCSVGLGHSPESEVILLSFFGGVKTPGRFWGTCFPSLFGFFQGQNFSVCFSVSSTNVWFPVWVLTLSIRSIASSGRSQVKKPFSKSDLEFRDLALISKI